MGKSGKSLVKKEGGHMDGYHFGELAKMEGHMHKKHHHSC